MADDQFRRQLAKILDTWVAEHLIEPAQRDQIRAYYQLDNLHAAASGRFATVLLTIGGLLVGLGIIVFVAANWAVIPPPVRAIVALCLMLGLQTIGFYLWRQPRKARIATACLFVGQMAMGASIGLMAQWFQVSGEISGLFLAWSLGILAMAYGLGHAPTGALGIILWLIGFLSDQGGTRLWVYEPAIVPWFTALLLFPLAYWCRSRWIFVTSSLGWLVAVDVLAWGLADKLNWVDYEEVAWAYVFTLPVLLGTIALWCWSFWHQRHLPWLQTQLGRDRAKGEGTMVQNVLQDGVQDVDQNDPDLDFAGPAQLFSLGSFVLLFYCWSFYGLWQEQYAAGYDRLLNTLQIFWFYPGAITISLWILVALVVVLWLGRVRYSLEPSSPTADGTNMKVTDRAIGFSALTLLILLHSGSWWGMALVLTNLALFVLGAVIAWQGLQLAQRWRFWLGLLTLAIHILTRFFEYETGLLLKSLALVVCGVGVMLAGLKFEQVRQQ